MGGREEGRVRGCEEGVCVHVFLRALRALRARPSSSAACTSVLPLPAGELRLECSTPPVGMNLNASPRPASTRSSPGQGCQLLDWSTNKSTWPPPKCAGAGSSRQKPQGR